MMQAFVLFSMPRTGSSMVVHMLSTHPDVMCYTAVFTQAGLLRGSEFVGAPQELHARLSSVSGKWSDLERRSQHIAAFVSDLFAQSTEPVNGFKQHLGNRGNDLTARIIEQRYPAVLLERSNILACYASNKLVSVTGQGALYAGADRVTGRAIFDAEEFAAYSRRRRGVYDYWRPIIAESGVPLLDIDYVEARTLTGMNRIADFLGVARDRFGDWPTVKRHDDDIVARFENTDDVWGYLDEHGLWSWAVEGAAIEQA